ncbi:WhiB family transcriptional regulator [Actinomadura atramentaria]|uniref:WhiB family transcriptional regulator n=1 Tax=Actinomadura atramentaria TaxID=1990 RepID=UPI001969C455|nr:WhiB family transcriptional regulator [Actinomadura atramentaria]
MGEAIDLRRLSSMGLRSRVHANGACVGSDDPDAWFRDEPDLRRAVPRARRAYEMRARQLCAGCPVTRECLELDVRAISEGQRPWGTSGARAPWERELLARQRYGDHSRGFALWARTEIAQQRIGRPIRYRGAGAVAS